MGGGIFRLVAIGSEPSQSQQRKLARPSPEGVKRAE
jgi:hypothetical protein